MSAQRRNDALSVYVVVIQHIPKQQQAATAPVKQGEKPEFKIEWPHLFCSGGGSGSTADHRRVAQSDFLFCSPAAR
jgi:hypothetical protein